MSGTGGPLELPAGLDGTDVVPVVELGLGLGESVGPAIATAPAVGGAEATAVLGVAWVDGFCDLVVVPPGPGLAGLLVCGGGGGGGRAEPVTVTDPFMALKW